MENIVMFLQHMGKFTLVQFAQKYTVYSKQPLL